jgi:hypothetical protein
MKSHPEQVNGLVTIKQGKVTLLKNVSELKAAIIGRGDPVTVLKSLADAGWKLYGDYELKIRKDLDKQSGAA